MPDGIRRVSSLLGRRRIRIHRRCQGLTGELCSYVWDSKAAMSGIEKPGEQGVIPRHARHRILCGLQRRLRAVSQSEQGIGKGIVGNRRHH